MTLPSAGPSAVLSTKSAPVKCRVPMTSIASAYASSPVQGPASPRNRTLSPKMRHSAPRVPDELLARIDELIE